MPASKDDLLQRLIASIEWAKKYGYHPVEAECSLFGYPIVETDKLTLSGDDKIMELTGDFEKPLAEQVLNPNPFRDGIKCRHLAENPLMRPKRVIRAGTDFWFVLCDYCSGLLVETILTEFKAK